MKSILFAFLGSISFAALGASHPDTCRVTSVNEDVSPWEEGLTVFGEGDSDAGEVSFSYKRNRLEDIKIGHVRFTIEDPKTTILVKESPKDNSYTISDDQSGDQIKVVVYPSEKGIVLLRKDDQEKFQPMATFDCDQSVVKAEIDDDNVTGLSNPKFKKLPKTVRERLSVDVAFELGDGYYSVLESKYYTVKSLKRPGETAGYLLWERLSYTEDPEEVIALVRFDAQGHRIGEIDEERVPASDR